MKWHFHQKVGECGTLFVYELACTKCMRHLVRSPFVDLLICTRCTCACITYEFIFVRQRICPVTHSVTCNSALTVLNIMYNFYFSYFPTWHSFVSFVLISISLAFEKIILKASFNMKCSFLQVKFWNLIKKMYIEGRIYGKIISFYIWKNIFCQVIH